MTKLSLTQMYRSCTELALRGTALPCPPANSNDFDPLFQTIVKQGIPIAVCHEFRRWYEEF